MSDGEGLVAVMTAIAGAAHVSTGLADRELAGADLVRWPDRAAPELVVRPADTAEVAALVAAAARFGRPVTPRGAGLSYTGGVSPRVPTVAFDLTRLNAIAIDADNLFAIVGAGCTWQALAEALAPLGLQSVLSGPISGSHSTIGGAIAQGMPGGMDAVLGITAVLADGALVRTGTWALPSSLPFSRLHGPDLTGLFIGDCGAFAIKTEISLRLETIRPTGFESYGFETGADLLAALAPMLRQGLATRAIAFDRMKAQSGQPQGVREVLDTVASVARGAGGIRRMIRDVAGLRKAKGELADAPWSLHLTIAAPTEAGVAAQAEAVRRIADPLGHRMEPAVPKALHARPYSIRGFVGPQGERWAPVHGIFPLTRAGPALAALQQHLAARQDEQDRLGVVVNWLLSSTGAYAVIEPMFYWPDALDPLHLRHLSERNRQRFGAAPENPAARALVAELRRELADIMDSHGAAHAQIGRFYRLPDAIDPGSAVLLSRIKTALDPAHRMNPGVLGLQH